MQVALFVFWLYNKAESFYNLGKSKLYNAKNAKM